MHKSSTDYAVFPSPIAPSSSSTSTSASTSPSRSSITTHSLVASSIDSCSSFQSPFRSPSPSRCLGLNLLVKAIHQVTAGSAVGVPYIQRRIVTRRRRPLQFDNLILKATEFLSESGSKSRRKPKPKSKSRAKRQRRVNVTMPSKYRDSVLQPLTPKRSSVKILGE